MDGKILTLGILAFFILSLMPTGFASIIAESKLVEFSLVENKPKGYWLITTIVDEDNVFLVSSPLENVENGIALATKSMVIDLRALSNPFAKGSVERGIWIFDSMKYPETYPVREYYAFPFYYLAQEWYGTYAPFKLTFIDWETKQDVFTWIYTGEANENVVTRFENIVVTYQGEIPSHFYQPPEGWIMFPYLEKDRKVYPIVYKDDFNELFNLAKFKDAYNSRLLSREGTVFWNCEKIAGDKLVTNMDEIKDWAKDCPDKSFLNWLKQEDVNIRFIMDVGGSRLWKTAQVLAMWIDPDSFTKQGKVRINFTWNSYSLASGELIIRTDFNVVGLQGWFTPEVVELSDTNIVDGQGLEVEISSIGLVENAKTLTHKDKNKFTPFSGGLTLRVRTYASNVPAFHPSGSGYIELTFYGAINSLSKVQSMLATSILREKENRSFAYCSLKESIYEGALDRRFTSWDSSVLSPDVRRVEEMQWLPSGFIQTLPQRVWTTYTEHVENVVGFCAWAYAPATLRSLVTIKAPVELYDTVWIVQRYGQPLVKDASVEITSGKTARLYVQVTNVGMSADLFYGVINPPEGISIARGSGVIGIAPNETKTLWWDLTCAGGIKEEKIYHTSGIIYSYSGGSATFNVDWKIEPEVIVPSYAERVGQVSVKIFKRVDGTIVPVPDVYVNIDGITVVTDSLGFASTEFDPESGKYVTASFIYEGREYKQTKWMNAGQNIVFYFDVTPPKPLPSWVLPAVATVGVLGAFGTAVAISRTRASGGYV
jgi:hypothetical protein